MKNKIRFSKQLFLKNLLFQALCSILVLLLFYRVYTKEKIASALFISGLLFVCIGLFRVTRALQFYDLPIYGFKKLIRTFSHKKELGNIRSQSFPEYMETNKYSAPYIEILCSGLMFILIGFILTYII